jgi:glycosyltransferase involved in cell wall biosynthesis
MPRIAFDARFYGEAGPGRYVSNVLKALEKADTKNDYIVLMRQKGMDQYTPQNSNFKKVSADYPWYSWAEQTAFLWVVMKQKADLLYVPHFNIPVLYPKKIVTAIPDIIMHNFSTEAGTTLPKPYFRFKKLVYRLVFTWAIKRSHKVLVPTEAVKKEFLAEFGFAEPEKFVVAPEGLDPDYTQPADYDVLANLGVKQPYILHVGSMYEHKNIPRLIEAFEMLVREHNYEGQLVLVGKKDKFSERIGMLVREKNLHTKVLLPGLDNYVSDEEVVSLRQQAELLVFPSLKEGYSLTPVEAQAVGLPCVISDIPVHREVYGDSVEYFEPTDVRDIANKVWGVLNNDSKKDRLVEKGRESVERLRKGWPTCAEIHLRVFGEVFKGRS